MSRFGEGDEADEEAVADFQERVVQGYVSARGNLRAFLAHLDGMPRKRIAGDSFYEPATGDCCAVAEFCRFTGAKPSALYKTERESRAQREENDGMEESSGWDGPTVDMGVKAGLPDVVAFDLGFSNDLEWDSVPIGESFVPGIKGRLAPGDEHRPPNFWTRLIPDENGGWWIERPKIRVSYGEMLPEERWLRLRNFVADRVGEPEIGPPPDWPPLLQSRHALAIKYHRGEFEVDA